MKKLNLCGKPNGGCCPVLEINNDLSYEIVEELNDGKRKVLSKGNF